MSVGGPITQGVQTSVSLTGSLRGRFRVSESENAAEPATQKYTSMSAHRYTLTYTNADEVKVGREDKHVFCCYT